MPSTPRVPLPREDPAEALENTKNAIAGPLENLRKHDESIPPPIGGGNVEVMRGWAIDPDF